jgi:hypothetical protein
MKQVFKPIPLLLFLLAAWIASVFLSLVHGSPAEGFSTGSYAIWGDWSAHLTFTEAFRERGIAWVLEPSPLFQDAPFRYPFLSHLLTAALSGLAGIHSIHGMILTSTLLLLALPFLLFRFFRSHGTSPAASFFATCCFLLAGGLQIFDSTLDPSKALTNQFDRGSIFTQFLIFEFFPQRAFLFGLCLFLWAVVRLRNASSWRKVILPAILLGLLPLIHLHSFIALAVFMLAFLAFPAPGSGSFSNRGSVFATGAGIAGTGALGILFLFHGRNAQAISWNFFLPGWAQNSAAGQPAAAAMNPFGFWLYNTGFFLPLTIAGIWLARKHAASRPLAVAGGALFLISLLFCIQPYFYDNLKLFTYAFLFLAAFTGILLDWIRTRGLRLGRLFLPLLALQCATSVRDLVAFQRGIEQTGWFDASAIRLAAEFKKIRTSPDDRVLINPFHNHPVPCLAGNPVVMGYPGWLWSWGIQYGALEKKVASILSGDSDAIRNLEELHPRYIVVNSRESFQNKPVAIAFFDSHLKKVLSVDSWQVYRVDSPLR